TCHQFTGEGIGGKFRGAYEATMESAQSLLTSIRSGQNGQRLPALAEFRTEIVPGLDFVISIKSMDEFLYFLESNVDGECLRPEISRAEMMELNSTNWMQ